MHLYCVCVCVSSCASFDSSVVLYIAMIAGLKLLELSLLNSLCFLISSLAHWRPVSLFRKTAVHPKSSVHKYHSLVYCCANDVQVNSCCLSSHLCSTVNIYHCKTDSFAFRVSQHLGCYTTPRPSLSASPCPFFFVHFTQIEAEPQLWDGADYRGIDGSRKRSQPPSNPCFGYKMTSGKKTKQIQTSTKDYPHQSSNTQFSLSNQLTQISIQGETETWQQRTSLKMYSQADFLFCCCVCNQQHDVCPDAELHHNACYCELEFDKEMNAILILVHKSMCLEHLQMVTRAWYQPLAYFQWISFVVVFCVIVFFNLCLLHFIVRFCPRFVIRGFISSKVICSLSPNKHESVQMWY